jgi:WD40 repeat protein
MQARSVYALLVSAVAATMVQGGRAAPAVSVRPASPPEMVLQLGHTGDVSDAAFSPNGKLLATTDGEDVKLWLARSGEILRHLNTSAASLAFSPDGSLLVTCGNSKSGSVVRAWDTHTWKPTREWPVARPCPVLFSPDGQWVTVGLAKQRIGLLRVRAGAPDRILLPPSRCTMPTAFGGTRYLAAGSDSWTSYEEGSQEVIDGEIILFDWRASRIVRTERHTMAGTISRNGNLLATVGNRVEVHQLSTGKKLWSRKRDMQPSILRFSPDDRLLVLGHSSGEGDEGWAAWDARTGRPHKTLSGGEDVAEVAFSRDGTLLALAGGFSSGDVSVLDLRSGRSRWRASRIADPVNCLAFSPDGRHLALGHGIYQTAGGGSPTEGTVHVWNVPQVRLERTLLVVANQLPPSCSQALAYSADGKLLAAVGGNSLGSLTVWDTATYRQISAMEGFPTLIGAVGFAGSELIAGSIPPPGQDHNPAEDSVIKRWNPRTEKETPLFSRVGLLAVSPDGKRIATFGRGSTAYLRPPREDGPATLLSGHGAAVTCAAFSRDGSLLATGCEDRVPRVWDAADGRLVRAFPGRHLTGVSAVAFSPDHRLLASAGLTTKLWDVETGKNVRTLHATGPLAFSPDGRLLAIGSEDEGATLWEVATGTKLATLQVLPARGDKAPKVRDWIAYTPDGFYTSSPGAARFIRWRLGDELLPAARLESARRRPERIQNIGRTR